MLTKTLPLDSCELKFADAGYFEGYASVFNGVDSYKDTIVKGAFSDTLKSNPNVKMFFNHKSWEMPVGKWISLKEDEKGLFVKGELTPKNSLAEDLRASMKHGTIDGLSIGFILKNGDYTENEDGTRTINKISNLVEVSPVIFPADDAARIDLTSVKNAIDSMNSIGEIENFLREVGGLSKSGAKLLVSQMKNVLRREADETEEVKLNNAINSLYQTFKQLSA